MHKLPLLILIGILLQVDIAIAHDWQVNNCKVPLTVLSGNIECSLISLESDTIECKVVKLSHITAAFNFSHPKTMEFDKYWVRLNMTFVCIKDDECFQAFDCSRGAATDDDGCHMNSLTGDWHCH